MSYPTILVSRNLCNSIYLCLSVAAVCRNHGSAAFDQLMLCQSNVFHFGLGHLTSKSDVYSFGVVLLEMLTGRRSMDKNRPNGEHNLVEWARPHFGDKRRFYRILDPRLEGHFSIKGAQKAIQLAAQCLSRDPKSRPRMSEVVEALKPLPNLKDMASSSYYFQTMQADRNKSNMNAKNGIRTNAGFITRNGQPLRSLSDVRASPYNQPRQSPKPRGKNS
jgi:serine/threonine protein kinase